jgi:DNA-binding LacI/PurR family transcriptional regulator
MTDVAAVANVSYQTVSRVLNDHPGVRSATRARVLAAIDQLGYRPNQAARALVTGRSRTLGVVALDSAHWSGLPSLYGIERAARGHGYVVNVVTLDLVDRASMRRAGMELADQGVAGALVILPIKSASEVLAELPPELPAVALEGDPASDLAVATVDQESGARAATTHLLELGHATVFHLAGPPEWHQSEERIMGWQAALESVGAEVTVPLHGDWSARSGYQIGRMLARIPEMTALFVANDQMALGVLLAMDERGRRVPMDVSVVGFDDIPEAEYFLPPLTTVRQDFEEVGRQGLEMLLEQIESGTRSVARRVVESELVVRRTTAGPP